MKQLLTVHEASAVLARMSKSPSEIGSDDLRRARNRIYQWIRDGKLYDQGGQVATVRHAELVKVASTTRRGRPRRQ